MTDKLQAFDEYIPELEESDRKKDFSLLNRVCHITCRAPFDDRRIFYKECLTLVQNGFDTTLIVANQELPAESVEGVYVHSVRVPLWWPLFGWLGLRRLFRKALWVNAEIYHLHEPELLPLAKKLKSYGKQVIYGAHCDVSAEKQGRSWLPGPLRAMVARNAANREASYVARLDGVVADGTAIKRRLQTVHPIIVEACDYPRLEDWPLSSMAKTGALCCVGPFDKAHGGKVIAQALGEAHASLDIAGPPPASRWRKALEKLPGWAHVRHHGQLPFEEKRRLLYESRAALLLWAPLPHHVEQQPGTLFDYFAAGLPVIASDFALWKKIIEQNGCGSCVPPNDPAALAAAIHRVLEAGNTMGQRARQAFETHYNWQHEAKKYLILYRKLAAKEKYGYTRSS